MNIKKWINSIQFFSQLNTTCDKQKNNVKWKMWRYEEDFECIVKVENSMK